MLTLFWVVALSLSASFVCSILEAVLLSVTHSYVELLKETGKSAGFILERFQKKIDQPIAAILTLNTIANTAGATVAGAIAQDVFDDRGFAIFSALLVFAILISE